MVGLVLQMSGAIMFWNLENYFDPFDDPLTVDEDFTPVGKKRWSWRLFVQKRNGISKTILAAADVCSGGEPPEIIGFAEVENYMVLRQMVNETPLSKLDYGIVHRSSPDRRGIDVALIFRKSKVRILAVDSLRVECGSPTRDILYVKCVRQGASAPSSSGDTLHLFVNHWPSKRGGASGSSVRRRAAADVLDGAIDSVLSISPSANVIVMGDFNDTPDNVAPLLGASAESVPVTAPEGIGGTIKYRGEWEQIDQFYTANASDSLRMLIFAPEFLLEKDEQFTGVRPRRTYLGPSWHGGLSDHLPILLLKNNLVKFMTF